MNRMAWRLVLPANRGESRVQSAFHSDSNSWLEVRLVVTDEEFNIYISKRINDDIYCHLNPRISKCPGIHLPDLNLNMKR